MQVLAPIVTKLDLFFKCPLLSLLTTKDKNCSSGTVRSYDNIGKAEEKSGALQGQSPGKMKVKKDTDQFIYNGSQLYWFYADEGSLSWNTLVYS